MMRSMFKQNIILATSLLFALNAFAQQREPVHISVNLANTDSERKPIWAWFGYDEPNYTYMKDGKKLLA